MGGESVLYFWQRSIRMFQVVENSEQKIGIGVFTWIAFFYQAPLDPEIDNAKAPLDAMWASLSISPDFVLPTLNGLSSSFPPHWAGYAMDVRWIESWARTYDLDYNRICVVR